MSIPLCRFTPIGIYASEKIPQTVHKNGRTRWYSILTIPHQVPSPNDSHNVNRSSHHLACYRVSLFIFSPRWNLHSFPMLGLSANRGIGFEIVTQLVASPNNLLIAACRSPEKATALADLKKSARGIIHIIKIDVSDFDSIRASAKALQAVCGETGLDYLINNAGIVRASVCYPHDAVLIHDVLVQIADDTASTLDPERLLELFKTNAAGPALVSQVCLPFLEKGSTKKILHISSTAGSIGTLSKLESPRGLFTSYAMSKAALNMLVRPSLSESRRAIAL